MRPPQTLSLGILLTVVGPPLPQVGCKALVFPKQFKTQQYYNILKQICPELEKAQPGALKSQRWGYPRVGRGHSVASWPLHMLPTPRDETDVSMGPPSAPAPTPRLPDLTTVIAVDAPLPGTMLLDEVVAAGSKEQHLARLWHTQQFLSCHDPINIQFTSVSRAVHA